MKLNIRIKKKKKKRKKNFYISYSKKKSRQERIFISIRTRCLKRGLSICIIRILTHFINKRIIRES
jgi:hypothetical protein